MATKQAALVDCGSDQPGMFVEFAEANDFAIKKIFETHAHIDHVAGLAATKALLPDTPVCKDLAMLLSVAPQWDSGGAWAAVTTVGS